MHPSEQTADDDQDLDHGPEHDDAEADAEPQAEATTTDTPTEPPMTALAGALAQQAEQYAAAEPAEKLNEGVVVDGTFEGPYDAHKALAAIYALADEVDAAEEEWKDADEQAKEFKKTLNNRTKALRDLITRTRKAAARRADDKQPFLKAVTADEETIWQRRRRLAEQLRIKNFYVTELDLASLTREDLDTLDLWRQQSGPVPPALLDRAHVAGEAGANGAACARCGARLGRVSDKDDYPEGAFVGVECAGEETDAARAQRLAQEVGDHLRHRARKARRTKKAAKPAHTQPRKRR